jgi:hypothetical protein
MASAMGIHVAPPLKNSPIKCHTMPSNCEPKSLKTKEGAPDEVSHFFSRPRGNQLEKMFRTRNQTFAGRSASRRMNHGNQNEPYEIKTPLR